MTLQSAGHGSEMSRRLFGEVTRPVQEPGSSFSIRKPQFSASCKHEPSGEFKFRYEEPDDELVIRFKTNEAGSLAGPLYVERGNLSSIPLPEFAQNIFFGSLEKFHRGLFGTKDKPES